MVFVYLIDKQIAFLDFPQQNGELLGQFKTQEAAELFYQRNYRAIPRTTSAAFRKRKKRSPEFTPEHRRKLRLKKLGKRNPNWGGLKPAHRRNISLSLRGTRGGSDNPMWNRHHSSETRIRISFIKTGLRCAISIREGKKIFRSPDHKLQRGYIWLHALKSPVLDAD